MGKNDKRKNSKKRTKKDQETTDSDFKMPSSEDRRGRTRRRTRRRRPKRTNMANFERNANIFCNLPEVSQAVRGFLGAVIKQDFHRLENYHYTSSVICSVDSLIL